MKQKAGTPYEDIVLEKRKSEVEYNCLCKVILANATNFMQPFVWQIITVPNSNENQQVVEKKEQHIQKLKQDLKAIKKERRKLFP